MSTTQPIRNKKELDQFKDYYLTVKPNCRNYLLIVFGLNTALRISDILQLTYEDIYDFENQKFHTHLKIQEQKTGKINCIYLNTAIQEACHTYIPSCKSSRSTWLFKNSTHPEQHISRYQAYRIIKEAAEYVGFSGTISCHSLRKTFGYHAWKQGTPPILLMNIYNHSSFQITKRYLGIEQDDKDEVFMNISI